jgi:hypothetical protein
MQQWAISSQDFLKVRFNDYPEREYIQVNGNGGHLNEMKI